MNPESFRKNIRVLILCTGNSCRSQMAEGFLISFGDILAVYSARTNTAGRVGSDAEITAAFRQVRDEMKKRFLEF